jgi:hypothetical protein
VPQTHKDVIVEDHVRCRDWGTFLVSKRSEWHERLSVAAGGADAVDFRYAFGGSLDGHLKG